MKFSVEAIIRRLTNQSTRRTQRVDYRLFFNQCIFCQDSAPTPLCDSCTSWLPWLGHHCQQCAVPLDSQASTTCRDCQSRPLAFDRCLALLEHRNETTLLIQYLKEHHHPALTQWLIDQLSQFIPEHYAAGTLPQRILYVPSLWYKQWLQLRQHGQTLAAGLSTALDIPIWQPFIRTKAKQQKSLSRRQRFEHIASAYQWKATERTQSSPYHHVAILDDVVTTGATGHHLAKLLRQAGVTQVDLWCLSRRPTH